MRIGNRHLIVAAALALGGSGAALAEGSVTVYEAQPAIIAAPLPDDAYRTDDGYRTDDAYRSDDARERAAREERAYRDEAVEDEASEDASERAERAARATSDEEHGGLRNWYHEKKDEARGKLGMPPDHD